MPPSCSCNSAKVNEPPNSLSKINKVRCTVHASFVHTRLTTPRTDVCATVTQHTHSLTFKLGYLWNRSSQPEILCGSRAPLVLLVHGTTTHTSQIFIAPPLRQGLIFLLIIRIIEGETEELCCCTSVTSSTQQTAQARMRTIDSPVPRPRWFDGFGLRSCFLSRAVATWGYVRTETDAMGLLTGNN